MQGQAASRRNDSQPLQDVTTRSPSGSGHKKALQGHADALIVSPALLGQQIQGWFSPYSLSCRHLTKSPSENLDKGPLSPLVPNSLNAKVGRCFSHTTILSCVPCLLLGENVWVWLKLHKGCLVAS